MKAKGQKPRSPSAQSRSRKDSAGAVARTPKSAVPPAPLACSPLAPPPPPQDPPVAEAEIQIPAKARVRLRGLMMNIELNGLLGVVLPPNATDVPGTVKVLLDGGKEVAARPQNLEVMPGGS